MVPLVGNVSLFAITVGLFIATVTLGKPRR